MMRINNRQKLEVGAYIVILALAVPSYFWASSLGEGMLKEFLINVSATFAGTGLLFFLLNRFFGIEYGINQKEPSAEDFFYDALPNFNERIKKAKSVAIIGITLGRTSNTYIPELQNCLNRGGTVRVMVVNPNHKAMEIASNRFLKHQDYPKFKKECEHALDNFETLQTSINGKFEIRFLNAVPPYCIWLFDENKENSEVWLEIYTYRNNLEPAVNLLPHRDKNWFILFKDQYNIMWESAQKTTG